MCPKTIGPPLGSPSTVLKLISAAVHDRVKQPPCAVDSQRDEIAMQTRVARVATVVAVAFVSGVRQPRQ